MKVRYGMRGRKGKEENIEEYSIYNSIIYNIIYNNSICIR